MDNMNVYETVIILRPDLVSDVLSVEISDITKLIQSFNPKKKIIIEDKGNKALAYEIQHQKMGHYLIIQFTSEHRNISKLELYLRQNPMVLKFMTLKCGEIEMSIDDFENIAPSTPTGKPIVNVLDIIYGRNA